MGDVILVLTDSKDPKQCIKRMRQRDEELAKGGGVQFVLDHCPIPIPYKKYSLPIF